MEFEKVEEFGLGWGVVVFREEVRVVEDGAAEHEAVELRIFFIEVETHLAGFQVAVDEEFRFGGIFFTKF